MPRHLYSHWLHHTSPPCHFLSCLNHSFPPGVVPTQSHTLDTLIKATYKPPNISICLFVCCSHRATTYTVHHHTTSIISITDSICSGYHGTLLEPFGLLQNIIRNIADTFWIFYHLNHTSSLRRFQCCTFYSWLYYYSVVALSLVV